MNEPRALNGQYEEERAARAKAAERAHEARHNIGEVRSQTLTKEDLIELINGISSDGYVAVLTTILREDKTLAQSLTLSLIL